MHNCRHDQKPPSTNGLHMQQMAKPAARVIVARSNATYSSKAVPVPTARRKALPAVACTSDIPHDVQQPQHEAHLARARQQFGPT